MKINIYITLLIALLVGVSCEKELNQLPTTSVSDEQIFSSVEAAQTALNAAHSRIGIHTLHTLGYVAADIMGEDATVTNGAFGRPTYNWHQFTYTYTQVPTSDPWWTGYSNYVWPNAYMAIDNVNSIIKYTADLPDSDEKQELVAKAHGTRGFTYLFLVRLFAPAYTSDRNAKGVILRLEPADAEAEHLPRASVGEVYDQIISDLTYAYANIKDNNTEYITAKGAALLLARAYMDMADWSNAKKYAEIAADNTFDGSNLMSQDEWRSGFKNRNGEWLWTQYYTPATCNIYASIPSFYYHAEYYRGYEYGGKVNIDDMMDESKAVDMWDGYGTIRWTKAFVDMFEESDCRKKFPFYFAEEDGYYTSKFGHRTMMGDADFPMARVSEAYLIKAEAEAHLGGNAAAPLNALQTKRGATPTPATLDNIYKERRKELYGEGHRLHDIKRLHQPLKRSGHIEHWAKVDLPADSPRLLWPIPENEMLFNNALTSDDQNDYWK